jgi:hypothetical protein
MKSRAILGMGVLCVALAACHHAAPPAPEPPNTPLAEAEATPPQPPKPPRKPPVPPAPTADAGSPAEIAPSAAPPEEIAKVEPPPPRSPLKLKADNLIGLDQPSTAALLGQPSERTEAAPATIWRYTARSCQLEIYFYLDLKSQVLRALHYEVKPHDEAAEPARSQCFADLLAKHEADPGSGSSPPN